MLSGFLCSYVRCVLRYGNEWPIIQNATRIDPGCPMAWLLQTDLFIAAESPKDARASLETAQSLIFKFSGETAESGFKQVELYCTAWDHWLRGDLLKSAAAFEGVVQACPQDVFALKRAQLLYFLGGQPREMLRVGYSLFYKTKLAFELHRLLFCSQVAQLPAVTEALTGTPFYHGMLGFALEQVGDSAGAEYHGRRGTDVQADDAWSHHAVAHALYNQVSAFTPEGRTSCCVSRAFCSGSAVGRPPVVAGTRAALG